MGIAVMQGRTGRQMSAEEFRDFQKHRPDHERWELLAGVPVMMTPPKLVHNRIADNLSRLLNNSFDRQGLPLMATQRSGFKSFVLDGKVYEPEPDVAVIDAEFELEQRYFDAAYLLAEIVSSSDQIGIPGTGREWIDVKCELYRSHPPCVALLIVTQDHIAVQFELRTGEGWTSTVLTEADAEIEIQDLKFRCRVADLYAGTPLNPRRRP
ncbi:Uma2 family endonuclease [Tardiphaga sp.]|jgi:Uma2 family endonuclease|uniref:Uma2 family endonuclease n=1 Tax=Tardiphaga sp. TaxID=1926292 RepID=UPI0037DA483C